MITRVNPTCQNGAECDYQYPKHFSPILFLRVCVSVGSWPKKRETPKICFEVQTWGCDLDRPIYGLSSRPGKQTNKRSHRLEEEEEEDGIVGVFNLQYRRLFPLFQPTNFLGEIRRKIIKKKAYRHKFRYVKSLPTLSVSITNEKSLQKSLHFFSLFCFSKAQHFEIQKRRDKKREISKVSFRFVPSQKSYIFLFSGWWSPPPPPSVTPYPTRNIFPQDSSNLSKRFKTSWGCQKEKENRVCNIELLRPMRLFRSDFYICIYGTGFSRWRLGSNYKTRRWLKDARRTKLSSRQRKRELVVSGDSNRRTTRNREKTKKKNSDWLKIIWHKFNNFLATI